MGMGARRFHAPWPHVPAVKEEGTKSPCTYCMDISKKLTSITDQWSNFENLAQKTLQAPEATIIQLFCERPALIPLFFLCKHNVTLSCDAMA